MSLFTLNAFLWLLELLWSWTTKRNSILIWPALDNFLGLLLKEDDLGDGEGGEVLGCDVLEDVSDLEGAE